MKGGYITIERIKKKKKKHHQQQNKNENQPNTKIQKRCKLRGTIWEWTKMTKLVKTIQQDKQA